MPTNDLQHQIEAVLREISSVGFVCPGTVAKRYVRCGKPNCHCASGDPHGPYYELTWKEGGVTRSRRLKPDQVAVYQAQIANRQRLMQILERAYRISREARIAELGALGAEPPSP